MNRRLFRSPVIGILCCGVLWSPGLPAEEISAPWRVGEPIITYWNSFVTSGDYYCAGPDPVTKEPCTDFTKLTPEIAAQAVAGGFNVVWINDLSQLPIAERFGL